MKIMVCLLLLISTPAIAQKKPYAPAPATTRYEMKGIVSFFFNSNQGYKPDVGATAYIIKNGILSPDSLDAGAPEAYRSANVIYSLSSGQSGSLLPGEESPKMRYQSAQLRLDRLIHRLESNQSTYTATADGQGVFSKRLTNGTYWVLIKSAGRTGAQMKKVVIANDDVEVAAKFEAD